MWLDRLMQIWKIKDLRKSILFVLAMLIIFRLAAHIPVPGVDIENLREFFASNQILGLLNIFAGGTMENFSIVMLGVAPYITSSIIFQLLTMIVPQLEALSKEGEAGRQKINQYTRWLTVPLALLQSYGMITILSRTSNVPIITDLNSFRLATMMITITAGTIFLMWLGELISEKNIGNGISLMIFAGIVSGIPGAVQRILATFDKSQIFNLGAFVVIAVLTIVGIVIITEGQRNVPVSYAKRIRGHRMYGGMDTHLPLRVNQAGMIPIIFAISLVLFPPMIAQFFLQAKTVWLARAAEYVITVFQPGHVFYIIFYFLLVVGFTYFYTFIIFHPQQIADNLQKQGAFIPGIRPGQPTAVYLNNTVIRIVFAGALFLGIIALLPFFMQWVTNVQTLAISGASLLIVVGVVIEIVRQVQSQLTMREYEGI